MHLDRVDWDMENEVAFSTKIFMGEMDTMRYAQVNDHNTEEVNVVLIPTKMHGILKCIAVKKREIDAFKQFKVYQEVEDQGQERLSSSWVMTDKSTPEDIEKNEKKVKVRLV